MESESLGKFQYYMSLVVRKPVFRGLDQVRHKLRNCTICVAETKTLISFAVNAKLICVFVFAYTKSLFSHDKAHMSFDSQQYYGWLTEG